MSLNNTPAPKPLGTFTAWCAVKRCPDTQKILLLDPRNQLTFDVVDDTNFEYPHPDGDLRLISFIREETPEGQVIQLLKIQSYTHDTSVFSAISSN